jgi:4-alpha-glucanotransferase
MKLVGFIRSSGILLHPTSLPGCFGIGDLGPEAYRFLDFLASAGQRIWQVLPLGPTGYGDSPYQLFSAFAGNPLLISLDRLAEEGLLSRRELDNAPPFSVDEVDFGQVIQYKMPLLRAAYEQFTRSGAGRAEFEAFRHQEAAWLPDYARFMALKAANGGQAVWSRWDPRITAPAAELEALEFTQFLFFRQWRELHTYARERGIQIMGDLPIYVAHDSADVWANPDLFQLDSAWATRR